MMTIRLGLLLIILMFFSGNSLAEAGRDHIGKVRDAIEIVREFSVIPENEIPPSILKNAQGIAIIPGVIKVGFIIGGNYGTGVISVRDRNGLWTNPAFITFTGGSLGWQIGVQSTDVILVFKSRKSVENITAGKFTIGADASVAVGPVGRQASAGTDIGLKAEIYSYSRSRGLFAGIALQGSAIEIDYEGILDFYDNNQIGAKDIFENPGLKAPPVARDFRNALKEKAGP